MKHDRPTERSREKPSSASATAATSGSRATPGADLRQELPNETGSPQKITGIRRKDGARRRIHRIARRVTPRVSTSTETCIRLRLATPTTRPPCRATTCRYSALSTPESWQTFTKRWLACRSSGSTTESHSPESISAMWWWTRISRPLMPGV